LNNYTNPLITGNDIKGYLHGIYYGGGGTGYLTDEDYATPEINNRFTYCYYGVTVAWGSYLYAGVPVTPGYGGSNSIWANTYDAYAYQNGTIIAMLNWWGSDGAQTLTATNGYIDAQLPLAADPWAGLPLPKANPATTEPAAVNYSLPNGITVSSDDPFAEIYTGIRLQAEGKINEAVAHYKQMINKDIHIGFALSSLAGIKNKFSRTDIEDYLENLSSKNNLRKEINLLSASLLAGMHLDKGDVNEAIEIYDRIISENPGSSYAINSKFEKFFAVLNLKKDT